MKEERRRGEMAKFLIEVPHEPEEKACALAIQILLKTGSHYLTNAEFGCLDGEHKAWVIVEVDNKEEARHILPPVFRSQAKITQLMKFRLEQVDEILRQHQG
jgi:hypothetical protein